MPKTIFKGQVLRDMIRNMRIIPDAGNPHVALGPVVWDMDNSGGNKQWYWTYVTDRGGEPWTGCMRGSNKQVIEDQRHAVRLELMQRRPIVIHDFDDELEMAKWCAVIWPCDRMRELRESIESERKAA